MRGRYEVIVDVHHHSTSIIPLTIRVWLITITFDEVESGHTIHTLSRGIVATLKTWMGAQVRVECYHLLLSGNLASLPDCA